MSEFKCKNCNFVGTIANFAKPCPKCGKDTIIAHLNKMESEIASVIIETENE